MKFRGLHSLLGPVGRNQAVLSGPAVGASPSSAPARPSSARLRLHFRHEAVSIAENEEEWRLEKLTDDESHVWKDLADVRSSCHKQIYAFSIDESRDDYNGDYMKSVSPLMPY